MLVTTTPNVEGYRITAYYGLVNGETIMGANIFRDFLASITDVVGGRSGTYENKLKEARDIAIGEIEGRIVASVMVGHDGHRGVVYYVSVAPDARRRGLGEAMMREAESWLRARQVEKLNLLIRPENEAVRAFYEKLGYQEEVRINMSRRLL
mgnify:CR=1 FL=1